MISIPKTEKALWKQLKKNLPRVHWTRIESGLTGRGIPDLEGCHDGVAVWVELKIIQNHLVNLTRNQAAWHQARHDAGGISFILACDPNAHLIMGPTLFLWPGEQARPLASKGFPLVNQCFFLQDGETCWRKLEAALFAPF